MCPKSNFLGILSFWPLSSQKFVIVETLNLTLIILSLTLPTHPGPVDSVLISACLNQWIPAGDHLAAQSVAHRRHLVTSGDILVVATGWACCLRLAGGGQGCCPRVYKAQGSPSPQKYLAPNVSSAEAESLHSSRPCLCCWVTLTAASSLRHGDLVTSILVSICPPCPYSHVLFQNITWVLFSSSGCLLKPAVPSPVSWSPTACDFMYEAGPPMLWPLPACPAPSIAFNPRSCEWAVPDKLALYIHCSLIPLILVTLAWDTLPFLLLLF